MKHAFSLVELSIVLVILGLLTGGILTGQSLIRAAELRSITTQYQNYQTAIMTFRDKYFALPGDMSNAERLWGPMSTGTCPNATGGIGAETCNGNGDGNIDAPATDSQTGERFTMWQHLANAGLIEGSYTGIAGSGNNSHSIAGKNVPSGKISNSAWYAFNHQTVDPLHFNRVLGNVLLIGGQQSNSGPWVDILLPEEIWGIDKKIDDGLPASGTVVSIEFSECTNAGNANDFSASYDLMRTTSSCFIVFDAGW